MAHRLQTAQSRKARKLRQKALQTAASSAACLAVLAACAVQLVNYHQIQLFSLLTSCLAQLAGCGKVGFPSRQLKTQHYFLPAPLLHQCRQCYHCTKILQNCMHGLSLSRRPYSCSAMSATAAIAGGPAGDLLSQLPASVLPPIISRLPACRMDAYLQPGDAGSRSAGGRQRSRRAVQKLLLLLTGRGRFLLNAQMACMAAAVTGAVSCVIAPPNRQCLPADHLQWLCTFNAALSAGRL